MSFEGRITVEFADGYDAEGEKRMVMGAVCSGLGGLVRLTGMAPPQEKRALSRWCARRSIKDLIWALDVILSDDEIFVFAQGGFLFFSFLFGLLLLADSQLSFWRT